MFKSSVIAATLLFSNLDVCTSQVTYQYNNNGYYIGVYASSGVSWYTAEAQCNAIGTHLASIHSATDQANAYASVQAMGLVAENNFFYAWIGINDQVSEGSYEFSDGTPYDYYGWKSGEPNNSGNEDCGHLTGSAYSTGWNDQNCASGLNAFVCNGDGNVNACNIYSHSCRAWGDPHTYQFDGTYHHHQGVGYFDFVKKCDNSQYLPFFITAKQEKCNAQYTCVRETLITIDDGTVISFPTSGSPTNKDTGAVLNGAYTFPGGSYEVEFGTFEIVWLDTDDNLEKCLKIKYSGTTLVVETSSCLFGKLCGICGFFDGDSNNDMLGCDGVQYDNTGVSNFRGMTQAQWQETQDFGDSCCNYDYDVLYGGNDATSACPATDTGDSGARLPDTDCLDDANAICNEAYNNLCTCEGSENSVDENELVEGCEVDACAASGNNLDGVSYQQALDAGYLDTVTSKCNVDCAENTEDLPTPEPTENPTPAPTDDPTPAPTDDPTAAPTAAPTWVAPCINNPCDCGANGGNATEDFLCRICHSNGCDECEDVGTNWKLDYNYPCVNCQAIFGNECVFCQDFNGCAQCAQGYNRVWDSQEDLYYCELPPPTPEPTNNPTGPTNAPVDAPDTSGCPVNVQTCSYPCTDSSVNPGCGNPASWGCVSCSSGYFLKSRSVPCVDCSDIPHCESCSDWTGCNSCEDDYSPVWNGDCGFHTCA